MDAIGPVLLVAAIVVLALSVVMVCRELVCWYFKINERLAVLRTIEGHLEALRDGGLAQPATPYAEEDGVA